MWACRDYAFILKVIAGKYLTEILGALVLCLWYLYLHPKSAFCLYIYILSERKFMAYLLYNVLVFEKTKTKRKLRYTLW